MKNTYQPLTRKEPPVLGCSYCFPQRQSTPGVWLCTQKMPPFYTCNNTGFKLQPLTQNGALFTLLQATILQDILPKCNNRVIQFSDRVSEERLKERISNCRNALRFVKTHAMFLGWVAFRGINQERYSEMQLELGK